MSISRRTGQGFAEIADLVRCPVTGGPVELTSDGTCRSGDVEHPVVHGQPVLVDFPNSILDRDRTIAQGGRSLIGERTEKAPAWKRLLLGENEVAAGHAGTLLDRIGSADRTPVILIVGGGTRNAGARELYEAEGVRIICFDVYASANTDFVADAHAIPLKEGSIDAVWIQAVLEHVLSPWAVADEIWRVLRPGGIVYAETPFLQPVHEAGYDFTRFTESGHRWLFRRFDLIDSGVVRGPGTALFQLLRYALGGLVGRRRLGSALAAPFFWLRFIDRFTDRRHGSDAASAVYFLGSRSETAITPAEMPGVFRGVSK